MGNALARTVAPANMLLRGVVWHTPLASVVPVAQPVHTPVAAAHATHDDPPAPEEHALHVVAPARLNVPVAHGTGELPATPLQLDPAGQLLHTVPVKYDPGEHVVMNVRTASNDTSLLEPAAWCTSTAITLVPVTKAVEGMGKEKKAVSLVAEDTASVEAVTMPAGMFDRPISTPFTYITAPEAAAAGSKTHGKYRE
jgi:hypothetical protein